MFQDQQAGDQSAEVLHPAPRSGRKYDEAYRLALELCDDPETAQKVATRFLEHMERCTPSSDQEG